MALAWPVCPKDVTNNIKCKHALTNAIFLRVYRFQPSDKDTSRQLWPYFDAVALPHGDSHGQGDGRDQAHVQQGETQTLTVLLGGHTGETGAAPEGKATYTRGRYSNEKGEILRQTSFSFNLKSKSRDSHSGTS